MQQLRHRYAETGTTIRNQILIALRREGLEINEDDIQDERKRPRRGFGQPGFSEGDPRSRRPTT